MGSIFTKIIDGELPGRFVWQDDRAVAFLTIAPINPGHTLVVPREEIDHWIHLPADLAAHLMTVAHAVGRAQQQAFDRRRVALIIAGMEVPHAHLHVFPIDSEREMSFSRADPDPDPADLDDAAARIRAALGELGRAEAAG